MLNKSEDMVGLVMGEDVCEQAANSMELFNIFFVSGFEKFLILGFGFRVLERNELGFRM